MTDTNGVDVLIAWSIFAVFVIALLAVVLRHGTTDATDEAVRDTGDSPRR